MLIRPYALKKDAQANICNKAHSIQQKKPIDKKPIPNEPKR